ncbi:MULTISPECIES: alpha/beta fold hydrolase [Vibrio]|jgi:predicted alpha/beta-hydrolase family hydrolase|uniref:Alpha/beta fold hydrolase n=1 Tax=Vibrio cyclitrophicus ZF270 TaxID=1136176 RepID=A0AAN0LSA3_9VIBR|nr:MULTISPECIES: alpha/beta fold hydrolase [Vibrio]KNH14605.1 alpha/beta hydrolase [Vibrio lentus]MBY7661030.1 alpha/beta fold hydrolase [Vibrio atlanticus]ERM60076.1 putative hydrolase of the alpha/beta-hydrolase fold [Vibrio cyclitrophicus FF75]KAA8600623.1 Hydrolase alpha/beta fold family [Vibrio cyclitrophicus]MBE8556027.1 alpha/beta fold hydrolase [Vibrio sp. OPT24]
MNNVIIDGEDNPITFIFAHGAGAGMEHEFMQSVAKGLAFKGIRVIRFNFPYMIKRAEDGKRRPPDRAPKLLEAYQEIIEQVDADKLVIGGKSMGGRMASHLSEVDKVAAMACLGFPFHPPGKPEKYKGEHLAELEKPCLILQGERDTFGKREEFADFELSGSIRVEFIPDGDHSFKPRKSSGYTEQQNIALTVEKLSAFIKEVLNEK